MKWKAADLLNKPLPNQASLAAMAKQHEQEKQQKFIDHIKQHCGITLTPEHRFHPTRKWRMDFACLDPQHKFYIEIDGGAYTNGRHTRGKGFIEDQYKRNAAVLLGWKPIHTTPDKMYSQYLIDLINDLIEKK